MTTSFLSVALAIPIWFISEIYEFSNFKFIRGSAVVIVALHFTLGEAWKDGQYSAMSSEFCA